MLTDPFGVSMGGSGLNATPIDLLKFAYLIAHEGLVDGKQLLSSSYIKEATSNLTPTLVPAPCRSEACGYGYQFWRNEKDGYVCYGMGGQLIIFLPKWDLICITTADTQGIGGGNQLIYDALYDEILPSLAPNPLPEDQKSHQELLSLLQKLEIAPLEGFTFSPIAEKVGQVRFSIVANEHDFSDLWLTFGKDEGTLSFTLRGKEYQLVFGLGCIRTGIFPVYEQRYAASGVWLADDTFYLRFHIIDAYVGSVHFEFSFGEDDVTVFMRKQEESLFHEFQGHLSGKKMTL